ncbi:MAG: NAD(P)/FAD-dependent oxidoreductase [Proteobacteria bacterium]|nr:NAD(P)/FAD-dependent oxidoreductase [Pseudomonadota bacterium]
MVVGAGHNGLVCATLLARAGRRVLVLEAAPQVGGAAVTREFAPGFRVSAGAHLLPAMSAPLGRELALHRHGLELAAASVPTVALAQDGQCLPLDDDAALAARSPADVAALAAWRALQRRFAQALHPLLTGIPPRLGTQDRADRARLLTLGWKLRRLGRDDLRELLRVGGMCVHDLLEERFELPLLKGALALDAVLGTNLGPRSPGTVASLLYRAAVAPGAGGAMLPAGGLGSFAQALARAARAAGAQLRTAAPVARVQVREDRVTGVVLEGGEEIEAPTVISNADPRTTFLRLLGAEHLDAGFVRRVSQIRSRGMTAKLHLAVDGVPPFSELPPQALRGRLLFAPDSDYIERAYNHSKYRECSEQPVLEITVPSASDPTLAPAGKSVLSIVVQYAPHEVQGGWQGQRQAFTQRILATLERCAPGLSPRVQAAQLLVPQDLEREFGNQGGHWHHAELALDQFMMMRPVPGAAQYRAPVDGLYLCGAGSHPGGGLTGLPGRGCALAVLRRSAEP